MVYGGGRVGLMGVVADAALAAGGEVIGVMPQHLVDREIAHRGVTRLEVVANMHERKARMAELADAFVALPGGAGTLEELFEAFTWGQLGLHRKPTALARPRRVLRAADRAVPGHGRDRLSGTTAVRALGLVTDAGQFLEFVRTYRHPERKWLTADEGVNDRAGR